MSKELTQLKIKKQRLAALLRLSLGWTLLWGFLDKFWGLGFETAPEDAWLAGGSPTQEFLAYATEGPFAGFYQGMAGHPVVDVLFMVGLLMIGLALTLGIGMRVAGYSGALLMLLMWLAVLPKEHNPFMDEHIIYGLLFLGFSITPETGDYWSFGKGWAKTKLVKKYPILR